MASVVPILTSDAGTLVLDGLPETASAPPHSAWDPRVERWRAPAWAYGALLTHWTRTHTPYENRARQYLSFDFTPKLVTEPRPYQQDAIAAWRRAQRRGTIVLPTGAGKSLVAQMAISLCGRSTLVLVPTLDLMNQWYDLLLSSFAAEVGLIGGGYFQLGTLTISTYSSAFRFIQRLGSLARSFSSQGQEGQGKLGISLRTK